MRIRRFTTAAVVAALLLPTVASTQATPADKGKAIGETINAALTAAVPGVGAIAELVKGIFGSSKRRNEPTQDEVKAALEKQAKDLSAASKAQLKSLSLKVEGIESVARLAELARDANSSLDRAYPVLSTTTLDGFNSQWNTVAKPALTKVASFDGSKLSSINGGDIRQTWQAVSTGFNQTIADIESAVKEKDLSTAKSKLGMLQDKLKILQIYPAVELQGLGDQLAALSDSGSTGTTNSATLEFRLPTNNRALAVQERLKAF